MAHDEEVLVCELPKDEYTEEELILKQQEEEAQRRKDAVCTYIGHLILHDEKFREMMHTMLEARDGIGNAAGQVAIVGTAPAGLFVYPTGGAAAMACA